MPQSSSPWSSNTFHLQVLNPKDNQRTPSEGFSGLESLAMQEEVAAFNTTKLAEGCEVQFQGVGFLGFGSYALVGFLYLPEGGSRGEEVRRLTVVRHGGCIMSACEVLLAPHHHQQ